MINNIYGKFCTKEIDHEWKIYDEDEIADKYPTKYLRKTVTHTITTGLFFCACNLSPLPIASAHSLQKLSNSTGLDQYLGNWENKVCLSSFNSFVGRAGYFPIPMTVQRQSILSPKNDSLANFIARTLALLSTHNFRNRIRVWETGTILSFSITVDGKVNDLVFIGKHIILDVSLDDCAVKWGSVGRISGEISEDGRKDWREW